MPRFRCTVEYDGAPFAGWQVQPGQRTVQEALQNALQQIAQHAVHVMGAGRTDAGVHARGQVCAFDLERAWECRRIEKSVNGLLAPSIALRDVAIVADNFQPRHDARERRYSYTLLLRPSPLRERMGWLIGSRHFDREAVRRESLLFLGEHDFLPFSFPRPGQENTLCTVRSIAVAEQNSDGALVIHIAANRFLHHMVRAIVGHLVDVGAGRLAEGSAAPILAGTLPGPRRWAPPQGLVLEQVLYLSELQSEPIDSNQNV